MATAMQVVQDPSVHNGPQRSTLKYKKPAGARTGGAVSDDSDGDDEADSSGNEESDDDDDADVFALPGGVPGRPAGRIVKNGGMFDRDAQAIGGAEDEGSNESDEEDYDAINEISDSEDNNQDVDEKDVLRSAEKELIAEFESSEKPRVTKAVTNELSRMSVDEEASLARRLSLQSENSIEDDGDFEDLDFTQDPFGGLPSNDRQYQDLIEDAEGYFDNELASWRIPDPNRETISASTNQKKVRFEETTFSRSRTSSWSSEDEDARDAFPDLLNGSSSTHMSRSQVLLGQMDDYTMQVDNESVYDFDFEDPYEKAAFEIDGQSDSDSESTDDSDDGDTTDEETADEHIARVKAIQNARNVTPANTPSSGPSTPVPTTSASSKPSRRPASSRFAKPESKFDKRPKSGTFVHDPAMASVSADIKGAGVKLVCPTNPPEKERAYWERARQAMGSRDGSPGASVSWTRSTPRTAAPPRVLTAKSTLGTMFDGNLDFLRSNDECGITKELLTPVASVKVRSSFASSQHADEDLTDAESTINLEDFVQMSDTDMEMDEDDEILSRPSTGIMSPSQDPSGDIFSAFTCDSSPMPRGDGGADLLDHFDQQPGLVSSFRNNQHLARAVSSLAANPAKRAQTSEANALQKGRRSAANTPMTPARKSRANVELNYASAGVKKNVGSPLAQKHRRSRNNSLSQTLAQGTFNASGNLRK